MVFPVVIYGCGSWTIKKAKCRRVDSFQLWCWRRLLRVPWTARRSNQSILKEISPGCSLVGLILKLKLQYSGHLMWRADSLKKTLILGQIGGRRKRGWQRIRWLDGITDSMDMGLVDFRSWWRTGRPCVLRFMGSQRVGQDWVTELNWDPDAWGYWGQEAKGAREHEMVEWYHQLNGHKFEETVGNSDGQRNLACCSPCGHRDLNMT